MGSPQGENISYTRTVPKPYGQVKKEPRRTPVWCSAYRLLNARGSEALILSRDKTQSPAALLVFLPSLRLCVRLFFQPIDDTVMPSLISAALKVISRPSRLSASRS